MDPRNKIEIDKCEICKEVFTSTMLKNKHLKNCHFENQIIQNHKCTTSCVKTVSTSNSMIKHINAGLNRDHKCEYCGKVFSEAGSLRHHVETVHEECKEHKCSSCGKSFSTSRNLKTHIKIHADIVYLTRLALKLTCFMILTQTNLLKHLLNYL